VSAAVDKIEEMRKPEDFIGHRKRIAAPKKQSSHPGWLFFISWYSFELAKPVKIWSRVRALPVADAARAQ